MKKKPPKLFLIIDGELNNIEHDLLFLSNSLSNTVKIHQHLITIQILLLTFNLKDKFILRTNGTNNDTIILKNNPAKS